jgi:hypothetical protein
MNEIRSYWGHTGKIFMLCGILAPFSSPLFWFVNMYVGNNRNDGVIFTFSLGAIFFVFGLVLYVKSKIGDRKLKRLKKIGKVYVPAEYMVFTGFITDDAFSGERFSSFRVKCVIRSGSGREVVFKSRRLAVCKGWLGIIPQPAHVNCDALVYVNPNNAGDFAVDIWLC